MKRKKILAIILARKGSKGIKNKNLKILKNRKLVYWPIKAAKNSKYVDKIIVSTDCKIIRKTAIDYGAEAPFLRPKKFAQDNSPSYDAVKHCIKYLRKQKLLFDFFVLLEPTSPLTVSQDLDKAFLKFFKSKNAKSLVSVSKAEASHPVFLSKILKKSGFLKPLCVKKFKFIRRQDLKKIYFFDGSLYISNIDFYLKRKTFNHEKTIPYVMPKWKSLEIDQISDLICARALKENEEKYQNQ